MEYHIDLLQDFINKLIGTPYIWWKDNTHITSSSPFWVEDSLPPDINIIQKYGCNNIGLMNLICRYLQLHIPYLGYISNAGSINIWLSHLKDNGFLEGFNITYNYLPGTLLIRPYSSPLDEGYIAIVLKDGKLAHCSPDKGIVIDDSYYISHNWLPEGYYTHICRPEKWFYSLKD